MGEDGNVEEKNIAKLDFDATKAIQKLDEINKKLEEASNKSTLYAKNIGDNLSKGINTTNIIDTSKIKTQFNSISDLSKKTQETLIKQNNSTANKIKVNESNLATYKEKMELKKQYAVEKSNLAQMRSTQDLYDKITEYAKTYIIYQGFNALKNGIVEVIDEMVELENQMVSIDRVLNESSLNLDNYRDKLIQVAYEYGNTFDNVADITLRLAQAGFDSQESLMLTEKTLLALNTAELDATEATDDMVAIMAQWGLMTGNATEEAKSYGDIIDKINKVADKYPTSSADILDALKKTSSAFNLAGASIDETIATITAAEVASQRGGKAIGTALSNITQQLKDEGRINIAESLGINFYTDETKTEFKDLMDIFGELADKMQELKDAGKENSQEMQDLLSVFTVFRRNIGASLLGEMSGEDSTYLQVLNDSLTATGYSIQENAKYMQTAKAAQAQFNDTLLELKTKVWDGGVEEVYRNLLTVGTDLVKGITDIIDKVGLLPTSVGAATLAFSLLNKNTQAKNWLGAMDSLKQINQLMDDTAKGVQDASKYQTNYNKIIDSSSDSFVQYSKTVSQGSQSLGGYIKYLGKSTAQTILLTAKTVILQTAISAGLTLAITALVTVIQEWANAEENTIAKLDESISKSQENADAINQEVESLQELRVQYEELAKKPNRTAEEDEKIYEIQTQINDLLKDTGVQVDLITTKINEQGEAVKQVNTNYDEQLSKLKTIEYQKKKDSVEELRKAAEDAQAELIGTNLKSDNLWDAFTSGSGRQEFALEDAGINVDALFDKYFEGQAYYMRDINSLLNEMSFDEQRKTLTEWQQALSEALKQGKDVKTTYDEVSAALDTLNERYDKAKDATDAYNQALGELSLDSGKISEYSSALDQIAKSYNMEGPGKLIDNIQAINDRFLEGEITSKEYFDGIQGQIDNIDFDQFRDYLDLQEEAVKQYTLMGYSADTAMEKARELAKENTEMTDEQIAELEEYQAIFAETTRSLAQGLETIQNAFDTGNMSFADYSESLTETSESLLNLYATQNDLSLNESTGEWFNNQTNAIDEYATSLQDAQDTLASFSDMMQTLGESYDYIAEHADAAGNAQFQAADIADKEYQQLAANFANNLANMRQVNYDSWSAITKTIFDSASINANEIENVDSYVAKALATNNYNLNDALNEASRQAQEAATKLGTTTGTLIQKLGNVIKNFDYTLSFEVSGGINPGGNLADLALGKSFKPSSDLSIKIKGSGGDSVNDLAQSLIDFGNDFSNYVTTSSGYKSLLDTIKPYVPTGSGTLTDTSRPSTTSPSSTSRPSSSGGSGGSSSSRDYDAERAAEEAAKAEQEAYDNRLEMFKNYIEEKERLEQRWVDKQNDLELLSNEDFLYITEQRIKRYQQYLDKLRSLTWINAEDRAELEKEYTEQIEDLQVEYFGYLKDKLDEEIQALEDANDEKIKLIEDEADKRIEALQKVEDENDRIRDKEDYEEQKRSIQEEIDYWSQRTGREAQENLLAAKKEMEELDKEWQQTQEDWAIEDQIAKIEEERDKQIAAIEEAETKEIEAMQKAYDEKVKLFAETGQLIYENSEIQSQALYNSYKTNFIDPIGKELDELIAKLNADASNYNKTTTTTTTTPAQPQYETYTIKYGDTLSGIAQKYGTTVQKLLDANPYITNKNKIYAGKTLQIPKFHTGGEVIGDEEGYALLKPEEMILTPSWAKGIKKLTTMVENNQFPGEKTVNNIKGNLVNIEATINNKADADYLTKKIEKVVASKLNIKK